MTKDEAWGLADDWVGAWNKHDLDLIMAHYDDAAELTSPVAAQLLGSADGKVVGKTKLRAYFQRGLEVYPEFTSILKTCSGVWIASFSTTGTKERRARQNSCRFLAPGK
jgi:hypothetical protein